MEQRQVFLEIREEVEGRHRPAAEESLAHPSVVVFEFVGRVTVAEDVDEYFAGRLEPGGEFGEEGRVAFHVFEHFDGEDVGESGAGVSGGRATGEGTYCSFSSKSNFVKSPVMTCTLWNPFCAHTSSIKIFCVRELESILIDALGYICAACRLSNQERERETRGTYLGEVQPQTPPSTTQIQDLQPLTSGTPLVTHDRAQPGLYRIHLQHDLLCLAQGLSSGGDTLGRSIRVHEGRVEARRVLHPRAEA